MIQVRLDPNAPVYFEALKIANSILTIAGDGFGFNKNYMEIKII